MQLCHETENIATKHPSILGRMTDPTIRRKPFPYAVVENALPTDYYEELSSCFPDLSAFGNAEALGNNKVYRKPATRVIENAAYPKIWQDFVAYHSSEAFFRELCDVWGDDMAGARHTILRGYRKPLQEFSAGRRIDGKRASEGNQSSDIVLDCQFSINSPVTSESSVRGPHLDSPFKLFAALLYFRHPEDFSEGGDFDIYRLKPGRLPLPKPSKVDPKRVELVERVPYKANTLVFFVNSHQALHGVTTRSVTPYPRRYINFVGECYAGNPSGILSPTNPKYSPSWQDKLTKAYRFKWALGL